MEDIRITNEVMPVIEINFEEVKSALQGTLDKYKGIVVTEETLSGCKATQKDLAGMRIQIDNYRKDKKKIMEQPIKAFEEQCKELISLVEMAEAPIKEGIKVFDDLKRTEKYAVAERLIAEVAENMELRPKYAARLTVSEKYCNLTAKESDVRSDLDLRSMVLREEQNKEDELLDIIKDTIEIENRSIKSKLKIEDFQRMISNGVPTRDILAEVKQRAMKIFEAENSLPVNPDPVPVPDPVVQKTIVPDKAYFAVYRMSGSIDQLRGVSQYLKTNEIAYNVTEQGEI